MRKLCLALAMLLLLVVPQAAIAAPDETTPLPGATPAGPQETAPGAEADSLITKTKNNWGEVIVRIQDRLLDLGYFCFKSTGSFGTMSAASVMKFQEFNEIMADGTVGPESRALLFESKAVRNPIPVDVKIPIGPAAKGEFTQYGAAADWYEVIDKKLKLNFPYLVIDLNTDIEFSMIRTGGVNHADMETSALNDTAHFEETIGAAPNWNKRPVIVVIDGEKYAASLQSMPHGKDAVEGNDMEGGCCLYFQNSKSDILNLPDEEHRRVVLRASGVR